MRLAAPVRFLVAALCGLAATPARATTPTASPSPAAALAPASADASRAKAPLAAAAFMEGHWIDADGDSLSEEIWTAPHGDGMLGMWRYAAQGRARIYELLSLTSEGDTLVLRLRHFDPALRAREERDRPVTLWLHRATAGELRFEGTGTDATALALTYRRPAGDTLEAVLEKGGSRQEFRYRRRPAAPAP